MFKRASGVLLHPTSLPGPFGIGDLGPEAYRFADFLARAGQGIWQVLPLGPTGFGDSPYQCFSAFAGNPMLISPEKLVEQGSCRPPTLARIRPSPFPSVEYELRIASNMYCCGALRRISAGKRRRSKGARSKISPAKTPTGWTIRALHGLEGGARRGSGLDPMGTGAALRGPRRWRGGEPALPIRSSPGSCGSSCLLRQWHELKQYCRRLGVRSWATFPSMSLTTAPTSGGIVSCSAWTRR